jgi:sugar O-acyltransferase (sialic acid O-acetyltransferase NeuD family)
VRPILLIGGGGHCRACIDVVESTAQFQIRGIVERPGAARGEVLGYPIVGSDDDLPAICSRDLSALVTVGQLTSADLRVHLASRLRDLGLELATVVSPRAQVSRFATIGPGTVVMHGAVVGPGAHIGANCIINSQALIEHDAQVGDHCHISTGALVNGGTVVAEGCFVGSGAIIFHGLRIGARSVIGSGALVRVDLSDGARYLGDG